MGFQTGCQQGLQSSHGWRPQFLSTTEHLWLLTKHLSFSHMGLPISCLSVLTRQLTFLRAGDQRNRGRRKEAKCLFMTSSQKWLSLPPYSFCYKRVTKSSPHTRGRVIKKLWTCANHHIFVSEYFGDSILNFQGLFLVLWFSFSTSFFFRDIYTLFEILFCSLY